jgi:hypothetical protein
VDPDVPRHLVLHEFHTIPIPSAERLSIEGDQEWLDLIQASAHVKDVNIYQLEQKYISPV